MVLLISTAHSKDMTILFRRQLHCQQHTGDGGINICYRNSSNVAIFLWRPVCSCTCTSATRTTTVRRTGTRTHVDVNVASVVVAQNVM